MLYRLLCLGQGFRTSTVGFGLLALLGCVGSLQTAVALQAPLNDGRKQLRAVKDSVEQEFSDLRALNISCEEDIDKQIADVEYKMHHGSVTLQVSA